MLLMLKSLLKNYQGDLSQILRLNILPPQTSKKKSPGIGELRSFLFNSSICF